MKKHVLDLTVAVTFALGSFAFIGCEKDATTKQSDLQNVIKCWGEDDLEGDIYYSFPDNPDVLIRLRDGYTITVPCPIMDTIAGAAQWTPDHSSFVCRGTSAVDCGNVRMYDNNGNPTEMVGTYAHSYLPDGTLERTYYNWHDRWRE
jgi:hypothetical protein